MSRTKNAMLRYQVLNRCFRNTGRRYFLEDLLDACNDALHAFNPKTEGIKRRQLFDDIRFMRSESGWNVPLGMYKAGKRVYYRYTDPDFSIENQPLNETEALHLQSALMVLSRFKGIPPFDWVSEMVVKLETAFNLRPGAHEVVQFDKNEYLKGQHFLGALFAAIYYQQSLDVAYQSFTASEPTTVTISPYLLKEYHNRWFLIGYSSVHNALTTMALDRIISVAENSGAPFLENTFVNFDEYYEDVVGVTRKMDDVAQKVLLYFHPQQAPYITTKPIHGSQKTVRLDADGLVVSLEIILNFELEQLLLSHGERVAVLEPPALRQRIAERLHQAIRAYPVS
jgi:predicted DNA-binding transcriptional regulator YafY